MARKAKCRKTSSKPIASPGSRIRARPAAGRAGRSARPCRARHPQRASSAGLADRRAAGRRQGDARLSHRALSARLWRDRHRPGRSRCAPRTIPSRCRSKPASIRACSCSSAASNPDTGQLMTVLPVDEIRRLGRVFRHDVRRRRLARRHRRQCGRLERCRGQRASQDAGGAAAARMLLLLAHVPATPAADHPFALPRLRFAAWTRRNSKARSRTSCRS